MNFQNRLNVIFRHNTDTGQYAFDLAPRVGRWLNHGLRQLFWLMLGSVGFLLNNCTGHLFFNLDDMVTVHAASVQSINDEGNSLVVSVAGSGSAVSYGRYFAPTSGVARRITNSGLLSAAARSDL